MTDDKGEVTDFSFLWYREKSALKIGDVNRYIVTYANIDSPVKEIYLRLKNIERSSIRAIQFLNGPFTLYCHVVPHGFNYKQRFRADDPATNKEVVFENQIQPGQTFNVKLLLNENSLKETTDGGINIHSWEIDIISQIVLNRRGKIIYDLMIGCDFKRMKKINHGLFLTINVSALENLNIDINMIYGESTNPNMMVKRKTKEDLWDLTPRDPDKPVHLIILTHGIFSNVTADMLYMKDQLEQTVDENILVKGYEGNVGKSEKGIKKLGTNLGNYLISLIEELSNKYTVDKISFIGHSLGGVTQLYAMKYILMTEGTDYFKRHNIQPINLVTMTSPLLGVLSEMSFWISWFLDLGTLGRTGRDLTLLKKVPNIKDWKDSASHKLDSFKPVLELLPDEPLQSFLAQFEKLTLYANAINDGIVPLRTSALLYLDYEALEEVYQIKESKDHKLRNMPNQELNSDHPHLIETNSSSNTVGEIPMDEAEKDSNNKIGRRLENFLSLNFNNDNSNKRHRIRRNYPKFTKLSQNRKRRFMLINAKGSDSLDSDSGSTTGELEKLPLDKGNNDDVSNGGYQGPMSVPTKASAVESAISTLICPIPSSRYIFNPATRDPVIFHDKYYHFKNLPIHEDLEASKKKKAGNALFNYSDWKLNKQLKIVRKYHTPQLNWRKVLVNLPPDAHNNIIVRRRFSNGYGWGVIDHLCTELFSSHDTNRQIKAKI
ncbi:uncharacterized protein PRCAT00002925001 [Priceomyces carsonii]|uniref:uncharacterized protein n=1 Tax=Priceomyces carsonii TaxID=28549 RepID=UPI002ED89558|nr:unnamed protein product [Priceomyces carsonii]